MCIMEIWMLDCWALTEDLCREEEDQQADGRGEEFACLQGVQLLGVCASAKFVYACKNDA